MAVHSLVAVAPSPETSGTSLGVTAGTGIDFPATPFFAQIWPPNTAPTTPPGVLITHKAPFAFDSPGLSTGFAVTFNDGYTPAIGDIVHDLWVEIDTAWDGTTPKGDFGTLLPGPTGFLQSFGNPSMDMTNPDEDGAVQGGWLIGFAVPSDLASGSFNPSSPVLYRWKQKVTAANPIKVVVSQDGTTTGGDPGSTQGSATLYLVTSTPV
jgi:hypothetical protein